MSTFIAALPMYDWPEVRAETDADWARLRVVLHAAGIDAPETLVRCNRDVPAVPGGIRNADGALVAPDPATLPPDELDVHVLWRHPQLLLTQTCWGPMELGLADHVCVVGQPDYSAFEGGEGTFYRSAIIMRADGGKDVRPPEDERPLLPAEPLSGLRFAYNGADSMSGTIGLRRDLASLGAIAGETAFDAFWSGMMVSGGHRQSVVAVAKGHADVAAIDCHTLDLCRRFEPAMADVRVAGWTARRKGLPFIANRALPEALAETLTKVLAA